MPECYKASQRLAKRLLDHGSNGLIYPSVRHKSGICVVCFRPALVYRPRQGARYELQFTLEGEDYKMVVRPIRS